MKKILAINGSPRKKGNTATLIKEALRGAEENGAQTELVNLYSLQFKGCMSCFACKLKTREHGTCAMKDDLTDVLQRIKECDALIFGSPVYFSNLTSGSIAFLERLLFSNYIYSNETPSVFPKKLPHAYIFTMNATEAQARQYRYDLHLGNYFMSSETILRSTPITLYAYDTYQFADYSKYESSIFDPEHKAKVRDTVFPRLCQEAHDLGKKLATLDN